MHEHLRVRFPSALLFSVGVLSGCAASKPATTAIEPRAEQVLRKMSVMLGGARAFSFRAIVTSEEPLPETGQMVTFSRENSILVQRPDHLFAESRRGEDTWQLWYAPGKLTLLESTSATYAEVPAPERIDDMLDAVAEKYQLTMPLADLLFADAYAVLTAGALDGRHVARSELEGVLCDHLLFTQADVDWQIWIRADGEPLPMRFVIDYKRRTGRPQFAAVLKDWNLSAAPEDRRFAAVLPENAKRVEMGDLIKAARR